MSPRRSRVLLAGLLAATLCSPALAQQKAAPAAPAAPAPAPAAPQPGTITPSHLALAKEVMLSSGIARSFDSILPAFGEQIKQAAVTRPELTKDLNEVIDKMQPELELQKQRIIDIASRIYATKLTEAELREIATFFRSPSGKRYVETQPQVLDEMVQAMQTWTQEVSEYMMVRVRAEMGKRGHQLQ
ncbi:DUF2059 domain-containing protein [Methylobacterium nonmethylotrophicum]|uniref:DUF2059 domain-containing protein n=1 Tax=Methylobacterium nonmethylotrophicum TaxID=1141884 RepID=A0A4Z0NQ56_9HYPH|nr:DUF2059 domain-containing protein [Methylobacterium nonmethylotrophicum]TGD99062.1 DUF2059 domain-containing protein [Methylobacterium nonmethylotrophicum]